MSAWVRDLPPGEQKPEPSSLTPFYQPWSTSSACIIMYFHFQNKICFRVQKLLYHHCYVAKHKGLPSISLLKYRKQINSEKMKVFLSNHYLYMAFYNLPLSQGSYFGGCNLLSPQTLVSPSMYLRPLAQELQYIDVNILSFLEDKDPVCYSHSWAPRT